MYHIDRKYNPKVAWRTIANNVRQITRATEDTPATYRMRVKAIDQNEIMPDTVDAGYYFTDYIGTPYSIKVKGIEEETTIPSEFSNIKYGALYNWYAATDLRNIANTGWHVPTMAEWQTLQSFLGSSEAGGKMKETGLTYWASPNTGATNISEFNGRGSGLRNQDGSFSGMFVWGDYWSTTSQSQKINALLQYNSQTLFIGQYSANGGKSLRLLKDSTTLTNGQSGIYIGNDDKIYRTICIGSQEWVADNLFETKYRNKDWVHGYDNGVYTPISNSDWANLSTEGMCIYSDNESFAYISISEPIITSYVTIDVSDDFMTGYCPTSGHCGIVHKSAYKGYSLYLPADMFRHLHPIAHQNNNKYAMAILWNNDPNPIRYTFENTDFPQITNYQLEQSDGHWLNDDYGEKPKLRLLREGYDNANDLLEHTAKPIFHYVDGKLDSIDFGQLDEVRDWIIEISR